MASVHGKNAVLLDQANLIVFASVAPDAPPEGWYPVPVENVPAKLRDPEVVGGMLSGSICQVPGSDSWFRVERVPQV